MQLIANGTQGGTTIPAKQSPVGTPGYAVSGVPGEFVATDADPDIFNTVLAELVNVVLAAGLTLDPTNNAQVLAAILSLMVNRVKSQLLTATSSSTTVSVTFSFTPTYSGVLTILAQAGSVGASALIITSSGLTLSTSQSNETQNGQLSCYSASASLTGGVAASVTVTSTATGSGTTINNLAAQFIFLPN